MIKKSGLFKKITIFTDCKKKNEGYLLWEPRCMAPHTHGKDTT